MRRRGRSKFIAKTDKDLHTDFISDEGKYEDWMGGSRLWQWFRQIPDNALWNSMICVLVVVGIVMCAGSLYAHSHMWDYVNYVYNIVYALHAVAMIYEYRTMEFIKQTLGKRIGIYTDFISYIYLPIFYLFGDKDMNVHVLLICFNYLRFHRPIKYLWTLTDENMQGSVMGTFLKYMYLFVVARISFAIYFMYLDFGHVGSTLDKLHLMTDPQYAVQQRRDKFFLYTYVVDKIFYPVGPDLVADTSEERILMIALNLCGSLLAAGAAVNALALVICLYMKPEESFRARFKLIMEDLNTSGVPKQLRDKVKTFYEMYWLKQKCVSVTQLMPIFPPTLPASIFTDIYFEGLQKNPVLKDLSYSFLWELSKVMSTIHYIPGDPIIKRGDNKAHMIYLDYGDMEMVSAEDDDSPLLRMSRGSSITSCGGSIAVACTTSQVQIRAATYCVTHVLSTTDLWRVASKYGKMNGQTYILRSAFEDIILNVKDHYNTRTKFPVRYKSSIAQFKQNIIALKEMRDANGKLTLYRDDYFLCIAGSYFMRNKSDYEEADDICLRPMFPCVFRQTSGFLSAWHLLTSILIFIVTIHYPYQILFKGQITRQFLFFDHFVTVVYVMDLYIHLSTGHNVEEGVPITFKNTAARQCRDPWFALDVLATLPILIFVGKGEFSGMNKLLRITKLFRVLKNIEEVLVNSRNVLRFATYCLMVFFMCYLMGAYHQAVTCFINHKCVVNNFTHFPNWQDAAPSTLPVTNVDDRIYFAFYFSIHIITFTAYSSGPLFTADVKSLVLGAIVLEISCILMLFVQAVYAATITVTSAMRYEYDACIENVKNFLVRNRMDPLLRQRFIKYLQLCWYTDKAYAITNQKRNKLFDLPPHVYQDIMTRQRIEYILCLPFMHLVSKEQLRNVAAHMRLFYTSPNEILLNTGDVNNEIYIINRGFCEVYNPDTRAVVELIGSKSTFGLLECLMRCPAFYTVRAVTHVQIFSIARKHLQKTLEMKRLREDIEFVKSQDEFNNLLMRREPFLHYQQPPLVTNRQTFPLPRKHIPDTSFLYPFSRLGFLSVLRYVFPRFTVRPDGKYIIHYEMFRGLCAFTSAMIFPSFTYLSLQWPSLYIVTWILDISGYFDIIQRLMVGHYNSIGILVYHPASTATHYITGAFIIDLFACMPLELLEITHVDHPYVTRYSKYLSSEVKQLLMFNRLFQLYRIVSAMEFLNNYIERRDVILAIKAIPLILVMLNVVTCLVILHTVDIYGPQNATVPWLIVIEDNPGGSWLILFDDVFGFDQDGSPWNLHLTVYFFVVSETITTGYGVFAPSCKDLLFIFSLGMFAATMIITFFSVLVISMRSNVNQVLATFQENIHDITVFMTREKVHIDIQQHILNYYAYNWEKMGGLDFREMLRLCDQITLRTDAILHIYGHIFIKCPILNNCDTSLLRVLGRTVDNLYFVKGSTIFQMDDVISDLFIIDYGHLNLVEYTGAFSSVRELSKGSVFGNLEARSTYRCTSKVICTSNTHLLKINTLAFYGVIADFPTVALLMQNYRPNKENFILANISQISIGREIQRSPSYISRDNADVGPSTKEKVLGFLSIDCNAVQIYLIIVSLLCIYMDVYNAGFQANNYNMIVMLYILDFLFFMKLVMILIVPIMVSGEMKSDLSDNRKFYLKDEFVFDVLSLIPIEVFCLVDSRYKERLFAVLRLNRMFRCLTIHNCLKRHRRTLSVNLVVTTVIMVAIWFSVFVHCTTCIWYSIGIIINESQPNTSWISFLGDLNCNNMYICSMFFVITTFTHNGLADIIPKQQAEVIFAVVLNVASSLIFMVYVGEFSNIIQYMSFRSFSFYSQFLELQEFMKNNHVSKNLVKLVNKYTLHLWRETRGIQTPVFLQIAPQCFKLQIMSIVYIRLLEQHPYFRLCEQAFLRQLVGCLTLFTYCEGIIIVKQGEITDSMYLIHRGRVEAVDEETDEKGDIYLTDDCFGSKNGLVRDTPFPFTYRAEVESQVLTLQLDSWEYLLRHFPKSRYQIYKNVPGHKHGQHEPKTDDEDDDDNDDNDIFHRLHVSAVPVRQSNIDLPIYTNKLRRSTIYGAFLPFRQDTPQTGGSLLQNIKQPTMDVITEQPVREVSVESYVPPPRRSFKQKLIESLQEEEEESVDLLDKQVEEAEAAFADMEIERESELELKTSDLENTPKDTGIMEKSPSDKRDTRMLSFLPGLVRKESSVIDSGEKKKESQVKDTNASLDTKEELNKPSQSTTLKYRPILKNASESQVQTNDKSESDTQIEPDIAKSVELIIRRDSITLGKAKMHASENEDSTLQIQKSSPVKSKKFIEKDESPKAEPSGVKDSARLEKSRGEMDINTKEDSTTNKFTDDITEALPGPSKDKSSTEVNTTETSSKLSIYPIMRPLRSKTTKDEDEDKDNENKDINDDKKS